MINIPEGDNSAWMRIAIILRGESLNMHALLLGTSKHHSIRLPSSSRSWNKHNSGFQFFWQTYWWRLCLFRIYSSTYYLLHFFNTSGAQVIFGNDNVTISDMVFCAGLPQQPHEGSSFRPKYTLPMRCVQHMNRVSNTSSSFQNTIFFLSLLM